MVDPFELPTGRTGVDERQIDLAADRISRTFNFTWPFHKMAQMVRIDDDFFVLQLIIKYKNKQQQQSHVLLPLSVAKKNDTEKTILTCNDVF